MVKYLVIVESLTKAKTINKYLGKNYLVKSSAGHIRDLPTGISIYQNCTTISKNNKDNKYLQFKLFDNIGIDPFNGWQVRYEILPNKKKLVTELQNLSKKVDHIYLATDLDREGEAIAWHLQNIIGGDEKRFSRIIFNEINRNSILRAFKKPIKINIDRVNAQQTRRFIDRIVGYMISPLLWKKINRGLSAGRVQSIAVKLIVEREQIIKNFVPEGYWELFVNLKTLQNKSLSMQVTHKYDKPFKLVNKKQVQVALNILKNLNYVISNCSNKINIKNPKAPFITSTLQQAANSNLFYSVNKTMLLAQRLYEAGYITYIRTDSTNLSQNAINMARNYIKLHFSNLYLPNQANRYFNSRNTQEAHEAIRPSDVNILAEHLKDMELDAKKLYKLIWSQFIASQMTSAKYNHIVIKVTAGPFQLQTSSSILIFDGWTKLIPDFYEKNNRDNVVSMLEIDQKLMLVKLIPIKLFTKPPARYSEASLVRKLEELGIGRPSTYASIISTIQNRGYVYNKKNQFYAKKIGEIVTNYLEEYFSEIMNYDFTANMEDAFDRIANKRQEWKNVLDTFFQKFSQQLKRAKQDLK